MKPLDSLRQDIDDIDLSIIKLFAKRFAITDQVGRHKAEHGLPARDTSREQAQLARVNQLAITHGVDTQVAESYLRAMLDAVVARHEAAREHANPS